LPAIGLQEVPSGQPVRLIKVIMGRRHQARELALQVLFHMEFNQGDPAESFERVGANFDSSTASHPFARQLVTGVCEQKEKLDALIGKASQHWRLERMSIVDRNVLRIAVYEVLFLKDIPPKVSIDEAVELGKKYGTDESGAFINGILDTVYHSEQREDE
jgi:transcription antitermination factor NusB